MKFVPIALYVLSWVFAWTAKNHYQFFTEALFLSILLLAVGVRGIVSFLSAKFSKDAKSGGFGHLPVPYQNESLSTNLALGVTGIMSYVQPIFSFGTALFATVYFLSRVVACLKELKSSSELSFKDLLPMLAADLLIPATLLYSFWHMHHITKIL